MGKPRLIILIRHGQSEGNKNRDIHQTVPDHRVKLTSEGWNQAHDAGRRLRTMLRADDTIQFFTSPYRRTRETTEGILQTLTSDDAEPSPFKRNNIKVYEEPRLREQDFGNFQPCSAEMERMWQERADYGHFFYRIPDGESAADAYDRVSGFNESLWRQFGDDDFPSVCVLVTHGLMSRVFLMKWYHFSVEYFEDLRNVNHCEFMIMRKQNDSGKYKLESKLRTWSELRRERAAVLKQKEDAAESTETVKEKDSAKLDKAGLSSSSPSSSNLATRRWGGCPNGCNHDKNFKIRPGLADLIKRDGTNVYESGGSPRSKSSASLHHHSKAPTPQPLSRRSTASRRFQAVGYSDDDDDGAIDGPGIPDLTVENTSDAAPGHGPAPIDVVRAREEIVSSPDATPSFITPEDRMRDEISPPPAPKSFLHLGRDFGGTYSGHTSDADSSEDDRVRRRMLKLNIGESGGHSHGHHHHKARSSLAKSASLDEALESGSDKNDKNDKEKSTRRKRTKNMANRLGDAPHCSDCEHEEDGLGADERDMDDELREEAAEESVAKNDKENEGNEADEDDDDDQTDVDHDLAAAEKADRSIAGSVY